MKKFLALAFIAAMSFTTSAFSVEATPEDCSRFAESTTRVAGKDIRPAASTQDTVNSSSVNSL